MAAETMTLDEAKKWVDRARGIAPEFRNATESALIALADALRAAEAQVAKMQSGGAEAMREAAARVADDEARAAAASLATFEFGTTGHARHGARMTTAEGIAVAIRSLPAPPARTSEPAARTYEDGVRDAAWIAQSQGAGRDITSKIEALLPTAPTPGPTVCADCGAPAVHLDVKNRRHSTPCCGSERCCFRACLGYDTRPLDAPAEKPAFDAEAALEAMRWVFDTAHDQLEVNVADVRGAIDAGLAAGRRGAR